MKTIKCIGCGSIFEIERNKDMTRYFNTEKNGILAGAEDNGTKTDDEYLCEGCTEELNEDIIR